MQDSKFDYYPNCFSLSIHHTLYDSKGNVLWACREVTNPGLPNYTYFSSLKMALYVPLPITRADS